MQYINALFTAIYLFVCYVLFVIRAELSSLTGGAGDAIFISKVVSASISLPSDSTKEGTEKNEVEM